MQTLHLVRALTRGTWLSQTGGAPSPIVRAHKVTVVCYFEHDTHVVLEFKAAGARVQLLGLTRSIRHLSFVAVVSKAFRHLKADIIHIQYLAPGFLAVVAARLARAGRVIATVHQPWTASNHGYPAKVILRSAALMCRRFTCVSESAELSWFGCSSLQSTGFLKDESTRMFGRTHYTIPNSVDLALIDRTVAKAKKLRLRQRLGLDNCLLVGAVSRLDWEKGIDVLIEAFATVHRFIDQSLTAEPDRYFSREEEEGGSGSVSERLVLLIVGDGQKRHLLQEQAGICGLRSEDWSTVDIVSHSGKGFDNRSVIWMGSRPWDEAMQLMSLMDICVVPSRFEGFGLSAAEAMACGKVVIASNTGGLPDVVGTDGGSGFLFPVEEVVALADQLFEQTKSKSTREAVGLRARGRVETLFSQTRFEERIQALYKGLLTV